MIYSIQKQFSYRQSSKRHIGFILKTSLFMGLGFILYTQIFIQNDIHSLYREFARSRAVGYNAVFLLLAIVLMPLNWWLEGCKWSLLINRFQSFSMTDALRSVLSGVSLAIMTPARLGEYGGRLVGIYTHNRPQALLANAISSLAQNIINIGIGIGLSLFFLQTYFDFNGQVIVALSMIGVVITALMLTIFYRIDLLKHAIAYVPGQRWKMKLSRAVSSFASMDLETLHKIMLLSFIRYLVYLLQYVLLIIFFGVTTSWVAAIMGVGTIFFLQSNLPLPPVLSVLARGELAIFLWSVFTTNIIGIVAATFTLWLLNLVLPAIIGTILIAQEKLI